MKNEYRILIYAILSIAALFATYYEDIMNRPNREIFFATAAIIFVIRSAEYTILDSIKKLNK